MGQFFIAKILYIYTGYYFEDKFLSGETIKFNTNLSNQNRFNFGTNNFSYPASGTNFNSAFTMGALGNNFNLNSDLMSQSLFTQMGQLGSNPFSANFDFMGQLAQIQNYGRDIDQMVEKGMKSKKSGTTTKSAPLVYEKIVKPEDEKVVANINNTFKGGLKNEGELIVSIANKYGIEPNLFAAILASESGYGKHSKHNNYGGLMDPKTGCSKLQKFDSIEAGLEAVASNLARNYIAKGLSTPETIGPKYCPIGAANDPTGLNNNWIPNVKKIQYQLSV